MARPSDLVVRPLASVTHLVVQLGKGEQMSTDMSASDSAVSLVRDPFLNTDDACGYLGVPKATLLTWRVRRPGYGPRAVKAGGRLKYRLSELDRWLRAHEESFAENEPPRPRGPGVVRNRNRANRVSGTASRASEPDGAA